MITVFIPTYNRLSHLKNAVRSCFLLNHKLNLIVLDNCSEDGTAEWLSTVKSTETVNFSFVIHPKNIGSLNNFLCGFGLVATEYFIPLADDDELLPGFISRAESLLNDNSTLIAVVGSRGYKKNNGYSIDWDFRRKLGVLTAQEHLEDLLRYGHYVTWSAILWRKSVLDLKKLYSLSLTCGLFSDVYFQFAFFSNGSVAVLPIAAATFNIWADQSSKEIGLNTKTFIDVEVLKTLMFEVVKDSLGIDDKRMVYFKMRHIADLWIDFIYLNRHIASKRKLHLNDSSDWEHFKLSFQEFSWLDFESLRFRWFSHALYRNHYFYFKYRVKHHLRRANYLCRDFLGINGQL